MAENESSRTAGIYARKSTGLVREGGAWSVLIYNINFVSIGLMTLFAVLLIPAFYPGGNMQLAFLLCLIVVLPTSMVFAMFSAAMPRSGGDYVYVSRVLGPSLGMMSNWNQTVWWILYGGVPSAFFAYFGLTPLFRSLGVLSGNDGLIRFGDKLSTPTGAFITGTLLIVALVAIFSLGLNTYFKLQNVLFVLAMIGAAVTIFVLVGKDHASFQSGFNSSLAAVSGTSNAFGAVMSSAKGGGFATARFSLYWTIIPMTWIYLELVFNQSSAYIGGEVRRPGSVQLWSMPFAAVFSVAVAMLTVWGLQKSVGTTFLGALSYDNGASLGFTTAPTYTEVAAYASGSTILAVLMSFGFIFWSYTWLPGQIINASRNLLAYGIDGVGPSWLGRVNERTHTPINALVVMGLGSTAALWFYTRPDSPFKTLVGIFGFILSFILTSIAAIVMPYKLKDVFENSPVSWRVGKTPVMSIVGVLSVISSAFMAWVYLHDPLSGLSWHPVHEGGGIFLHSRTFNMFLLNILIFLSGLVIYLVARAVQSRRGIELDATFKEIPIE
ncbi:MAG: APC family permease [Actinobacteria bacterium]|nr:APC family permease [Actinomycetota bacterium]